MTKVLGDNPFASDDEDKAAEKKPRKAPPRASKTAAAPKKKAAAKPAKEQPAKKPRTARKTAKPAEPEPAPPPPAAEAAPPVTAMVLLPEQQDTAPAHPHPPLSPLARRYRALAMRFTSAAVDEFGRDERLVRRLQPGLEFLYQRYFRVETSGLHHIPDAGPALIVANHGGTLPYDATMLMYAVQREHPQRRLVRPLLEDEAFHVPYLGPLLNRLGVVRACPENAERLLLQGQAVAVFPEGQKGSGKLFSERYHLQRFGRGGFARIALRTGAPIIPAVIVGAEEAQPLLMRLGWPGRLLGLPYLPVTPTFPWLGPIGLLPLPTKWWIALCPPLQVEAGPDPANADDSDRVTQIVEQVRNIMREKINHLLQRRRSVILG